MGRSKPLIHVFLSLLLLTIAIVVPVILWQLHLPIIEATFDGSAHGTIESQPFELFSFFLTILLVGNTYLEISRFPKKTLETVVPVVLPLLVYLNLLYILNETFQVKSSDYMCYEEAAKAVISGLNPYNGHPACYLYPPLLAQALASLGKIISGCFLFSSMDHNQIWTTVTYGYQCGQALQVILAYYLTFSLAQDLRLKVFPASLLTASLFLFNDPLIRTLTFDQVNLWILNSFLLGIILLKRFPFLGGLAVALGAHIKLYTLILLLPWVATKRWKALWGMIIFFVFILIVQTDGGKDWTLWQQFLLYFRNPEKPSNYRNNGIWSLFSNTVEVFDHFWNLEVLMGSLPLVVAVLNLLILFWFIKRLIQREKIFYQRNKSIKGSIDASWLYVFRLYGHSIDAIALSLLISPSVWEHHYVIAIPIALFAIATSQPQRLWLACMGTFLMLAIPTFEIFPLSFHRLVGLLILIWLISPAFVQNYFFSTGTVAVSSKNWAEE